MNEEVIDFAVSFSINIKMTSADAPWQNGAVERHHATADIIFEKLLLKNPKMDPQEAINHAARFAPLQLMMGQSPQFPDLAEVSPASSSLKSSSKYMKTLKNIDAARVKFREIECDAKLKKAMSEKINPNVEKSYMVKHYTSGLEIFLEESQLRRSDRTTMEKLVSRRLC